MFVVMFQTSGAERSHGLERSGGTFGVAMAGTSSGRRGAAPSLRAASEVGAYRCWFARTSTYVPACLAVIGRLICDLRVSIMSDLPSAPGDGSDPPS